MGNVSETLAGVDGIQLYYIVGILLFVGMFLGVLIHTLLIPKRDLQKFKSSIFEIEELNN
jgi:hypothetical protein